MAYLRKNQNTWQLQYYLDGKKKYKHFSIKTPKSIVLAEKKRLEAEIALHNANIKKYVNGTKRVDFITISDLTDRVVDARKNEVSQTTIKRNYYAMKLFMEIVGSEMPISELTSNHIDQYKKALFENALNKYHRKSWKIDKDKIKRGINKNLENVKTVLKYGAEKGIIPKDMIPKIERFKTDRQRLPKYLNDNEIINVANQLTGEARLAFWIIRYTGARRSEIARTNLNDERGLKWKDIDWMRDKVRLYSKKKERFVPLHPKLRKLLLDRKSELSLDWNPDDHIIHFVKDTLTDYFSRAMKKAGVKKQGGAVHILRHTAITKILKACKDIRVAQEFAGHEDISTTQIYLHVIQGEVEKAVNEAF